MLKKIIFAFAVWGLLAGCASSQQDLAYDPVPGKKTPAQEKAASAADTAADIGEYLLLMGM